MIKSLIHLSILSTNSLKYYFLWIFEKENNQYFNLIPLKIYIIYIKYIWRKHTHKYRRIKTALIFNLGMSIEMGRNPLNFTIESDIPSMRKKSIEDSEYFGQTFSYLSIQFYAKAIYVSKERFVVYIHSNVL